MEQKNAAKFVSADGKISLFCDAGVALGDLHDFLLEIKGGIVDRMVKHQKEEEAEADENMKDKDQEPS